MESRELDEKIVRELRSIKVLVGLAAVSVFLMMLANAVQMFWAFRMTEPFAGLADSAYFGGADGQSFRRKTEELLLSGSYDQVFELTETRRKSKPNDPYVYSHSRRAGQA